MSKYHSSESMDKFTAGKHVKRELTVFKSLDLHLADVDARLDVDAVRRARDLLIGEEDAGVELSHRLRLELDPESVVLLIQSLHRNIQTALVRQRNRNITCNKSEVT